MAWLSNSVDVGSEGKAAMILPAGRVVGETHPPGSKSGTNRAINLAILSARGSAHAAPSGVTLRGALISEDTELFLDSSQETADVGVMT